MTRADAARACWDLGGREEAAKVAVAKAGGRKLAAADSGEKRHVVGVTDAQGADTAPAVGDRPGHLRWRAGRLATRVGGRGLA